MISLNSSAVLAYQAGGATIETDDHAALTGLEVDWNRGAATLTYSYGTGAGVFTPGARPPAVTVTLDLARGGWMSSTGVNGLLTPAQLGQVVTALTNTRNAAESFAAGPAGNFLPGVTTAW
jgi:hypothetical protein